MTSTKRIVLIDDHPVFREGLKVFLGREPNWEIAAEAGNAADGLKSVCEHNPDIVLLDVFLPDKRGVELIEDIDSLSLTPKIIMVSSNSTKTIIADALLAGALGYVPKDKAGEQILQAVKAVLSGEYYVDGFSARDAMSVVLHATKEALDNRTGKAGRKLSKREKEVLRLIAMGVSAVNIGEKLNISRKTVDAHRARILLKLELTNTADMVRYAIQNGLIDLEQN